MSQTSPLQLEDLFFPIQEVRANPEHDIKGAPVHTHINQAVHVHTLDAGAGRFGVQITLSTAPDQSVNPPYFFTLDGFAVVVVDQQLDPVTAQALVHANGQMIVLGAMRERLLDLTSRAPWGRFMLSTMPITGSSFHRGDCHP